MSKRKYIKWTILLIWMLVIFLFSHQPQSGQATYSIIEKIFPVLKDSKQIEILNFIIRKCAHFTEYFILTLLIFSLLKEYQIKKRYIISIMLCFIYACTDEFHQLFIIGRTANFRDCLIDTLGGIFYLILNKLVTTKRKNVEKI